MRCEIRRMKLEKTFEERDTLVQAVVRIVNEVARDPEGQMPQEQFQRVKQEQKPSPESSEEDRDSTVTACTGNDAIRNQTHEAGKDI